MQLYPFNDCRHGLTLTAAADLGPVPSFLTNPNLMFNMTQSAEKDLTPNPKLHLDAEGRGELCANGLSEGVTYKGWKTARVLAHISPEINFRETSGTNTTSSVWALI